MDLEYTDAQHHENMLIYKKIASSIVLNFERGSNDIFEYYDHLSSCFLLHESYIEKGIYDMDSMLEGIIMGSLSILSNDNQEMEILFDELWDIYDKKNWKYGNTDEFRIMCYSPIANLMMLAQKIKRLKSQIKNGIELGKESFDDTVMDLINYCMIYLIWLEKGMPIIRKIKLSMCEED